MRTEGFAAVGLAALLFLWCFVVDVLAQRDRRRWDTREAARDPLALPPHPEHPELVVQALAAGWWCACGGFNGDAKEFRMTCRACDAPRPKRGG